MAHKSLSFKAHCTILTGIHLLNVEISYLDFLYMLLVSYPV